MADGPLAIGCGSNEGMDKMHSWFTTKATEGRVQ